MTEALVSGLVREVLLVGSSAAPASGSALVSGSPASPAAASAPPSGAASASGSPANPDGGFFGKYAIV